jgi:nitronate monooxygenase
MVASTNFADMVTTAIEEKIDIIFSGGGLPLILPAFHKPGSKTKLVPIVSSARASSIIFKTWINKYNYVPDAIVVEGPEAGGHLGFKPENIYSSEYSLEKIIPEVIKVTKFYELEFSKAIPVIAGGGIYSGEDIHKFIKMGASGVQMGTRFVTTDECDVSEKFKQMYIDAKEEDIHIIKSPVGMPGRAIKNDFLIAVENGEKMPYQCPYHCIITCDYTNSPYCIAYALLNASTGNMKHGFAFAGTNAYRAKKIMPVKELIDSLIEEYNKQLVVNAKGPKDSHGASLRVS